MPQTSAIASARIGTHRITPAASYNQLFRFHPPKDGAHPAARLLDVNGTLYGTTARGGLSHHGTVYRISSGGVQKVLYRFRGGSDGSAPQSGLIDVNGTLYGTTLYGGRSGCSYSRGCGTVYSISTSGTEKVLYAFEGGSDGANPYAGLIDVKGMLYGTTSGGGGYSECITRYSDGCGTVFTITTSGHETVLHRFLGGSDGAFPNADLIDVNGVLYGSTANGGRVGAGTVYSITPAGAEKVLHAFQRSPDGYAPVGLINVKGTLYGTTVYGGVYGSCTGIGCGIVYTISKSGSEKVLYNFKGGSDGEQPQAAMIEVNGVLYGTTMYGGGGSPCFGLGDNCGTVFSITTAGVESVLYGFQGGTDGGFPMSGLIDVSGTLYGTTFFGGDHDLCCSHPYGEGYGTVFTLSL
jgi:uncharacterized repeat protein (TIGR03803 family)